MLVEDLLMPFPLGATTVTVRCVSLLLCPGISQHDWPSVACLRGMLRSFLGTRDPQIASLSLIPAPLSVKCSRRNLDRAVDGLRAFLQPMCAPRGGSTAAALPVSVVFLVYFCGVMRMEGGNCLLQVSPGCDVSADNLYDSLLGSGVLNEVPAKMVVLLDPSSGNELDLSSLSSVASVAPACNDGDGSAHAHRNIEYLFCASEDSSREGEMERGAAGLRPLIRFFGEQLPLSLDSLLDSRQQVFVHAPLCCMRHTAAAAAATT